MNSGYLGIIERTTGGSRRVIGGPHNRWVVLNITGPFLFLII